MNLFVQLDPATDDINELPARILDIAGDYLLPSFTSQMSRAKPEDFLSIARDYDITFIRQLKDERRVEEIWDEIKDLTRAIKHGSEAWEEGTDECSMAECDPSDQYCKSMEIEELEKELKTLIV